MNDVGHITLHNECTSAQSVTWCALTVHLQQMLLDHHVTIHRVLLAADCLSDVPARICLLIGSSNTVEPLVTELDTSGSSAGLGGIGMAR